MPLAVDVFSHVISWHEMSVEFTVYTVRRNVSLATIMSPELLFASDLRKYDIRNQIDIHVFSAA